eukprot:5023724-Amphidinium_carterae.1
MHYAMRLSLDYEASTRTLSMAMTTRRHTTSATQWLCVAILDVLLTSVGPLRGAQSHVSECECN